jgi:hypothetical protein
MMATYRVEVSLLGRQPQQGRAYSVSTVRPAAEVDRRRRETQYLAMMAVRLACIPLAFLATGPLRWGLLAGAILLPWIAVLVANNRANPNPERIDPIARGIGNTPPADGRADDTPTGLELPPPIIQLPSTPTAKPTNLGPRHAPSDLPNDH